MKQRLEQSGILTLLNKLIVSKIKYFYSPAFQYARYQSLADAVDNLISVPMSIVFANCPMQAEGSNNCGVECINNACRVVGHKAAGTLTRASILHMMRLWAAANQ
jgi:hypothetical protein